LSAKPASELVGCENTPSQNRVRETRHPAPEPDVRSRGAIADRAKTRTAWRGYPPDQGLPGRPCARGTRAALPNLTAGEPHPRAGALFWCNDETGVSLRSLTSRPVTGIPNGPRPPPGWFPEPEDARPSTPGSSPGRAGRPPTIRGGNGSHTSHPGLLTRTAASVRSESPRNRIAPGPT